MEKNRKYICAHYISNFLPLTEIWVYNQIKYLVEYKPTVLTRTTNNSELFPINKLYSLKERGNLFYLLNVAISKLINFIPFFYSACKTENANILHIHFGYNGIKFLKLKRVLKIPMICSFYGTDAFKFPLQKKSNLKKLQNLFSHADAVLVLGPFMKKSLIDLGCPANKIIIHHLGIETQKIEFKERNISENRPLKFLLASSFVEKKGIDICLKALAKINHKLDFKIEIIGDGILRSQINALIDQLNLRNKVTLHGYQTYEFMLNLAYSCDAFLQASKTSSQNDKEGTPMVFVDMMATGLPVISTNHSDIPEIIDDGISGFLAEENNIDSFADKILEFVNSKDRISGISINSREKVELEFSAIEQAKKLEKIYSQYI